MVVWSVVVVVCLAAQAETKEISNAEQFVAWAENEFTGSENITLTGDLVFNETTTLTGPVGWQNETAFNGTFDGGGFTISHLSLSSNNNVGLFLKLV